MERQRVLLLVLVQFSLLNTSWAVYSIRDCEYKLQEDSKISECGVEVLGISKITTCFDFLEDNAEYQSVSFSKETQRCCALLHGYGIQLVKHSGWSTFFPADTAYNLSHSALETDTCEYLLKQHHKPTHHTIQVHKAASLRDCFDFLKVNNEAYQATAYNNKTGGCCAVMKGRKVEVAFEPDWSTYLTLDAEWSEVKVTTTEPSTEPAIGTTAEPAFTTEITHHYSSSIDFDKDRTEATTVPESEPSVEATVVTETDRTTTASFARDCEEIQLYNPGAKSGVYVIDPPGSAGPTETYCAMNIFGGGWTVFQRRLDNSPATPNYSPVGFQGYCSTLDFVRNWQQYKAGFGSPSSNYWLGNENIHQLTAASNERYTLLVYMTHCNPPFVNCKNYNEGIGVVAYYDKFSLESEVESYTLRLGKFACGNGGDSLNTYANGAKFSTYDHEAIAGPWCGGWWRGKSWPETPQLEYSNLNGVYGSSDICHALHWGSFSLYGANTTTMMMRRTPIDASKYGCAYSWPVEI